MFNALLVFAYFAIGFTLALGYSWYSEYYRELHSSRICYDDDGIKFFLVIGWAVVIPFFTVVSIFYGIYKFFELCAKRLKRNAIAHAKRKMSKNSLKSAK